MAAHPGDVTVNVHANVDADALALAADQLRETLRALVAGLVTDGFTDQQARDVVVAALTSYRRGP